MPEILKKKTVVPLAYIFLIVCVFVFFLSISPPAIIEVVNQSHHDIPVGEIYGQKKIGQTFEVDHKDLSAIEVMLATFSRENKGPFVFHLREDLKSEDDLVVYNSRMIDVQDNTFFRFSFPKIENYKGEEILFSKGKKYYFFLEAPHAEPGNAITIWSSTEDLYKDGEKIINGAPSQGDLVFKTEYELGWRLNVHTLAVRLMSTLSFLVNLFKNQVFYFVILLMVFVWAFTTAVKKYGIFKRQGGFFLIFGIVFFVVSLWIILLFFKKIEVYNQFDNTHTVGEIYGSQKVGQTFRAQHDSLMAIEVFIGTYHRKNTGKLIFHLRGQGEKTIDLSYSEIDLSTIKDNRYHRFKIPKIKSSQGKKYFFYLEAPDSRPGNAITIWSNDKDDPYKEGEKIISGEEAQGDLVFKTIYAVNPWGKIDILLEEITRNKSSPLNKKSFYVGLAVSFVLACSLFLTSIIRVVVKPRAPERRRGLYQ